MTTKASRPDGDESVFPDESRGHKYFVEQIATLDIAGTSASQLAATMQLEWTGALKQPSRIREVHLSQLSFIFTSRWHN